MSYSISHLASLYDSEHHWMCVTGPKSYCGLQQAEPVLSMLSQLN